MKSLLEIRGANDEASLSRLSNLQGLTINDMGPVRASFRAWPTWRFWALGATFTLPGFGMMAVAPDQVGVILGVIWVGSVGVIWGFLFMNYGLEHHRVCERGLVVGKLTSHFVPWETIDPGRVRIGPKIGFIGRHPQVDNGSPRFRVGTSPRIGLVLNGLDARTTFLAAVDPLRRPHGRSATPFAWWVLGTKRPHELAAAIEQAMVADGYPAHGLAASAAAQPLTVPWKVTAEPLLAERLATDPVIGTRGPST